MFRRFLMLLLALAGVVQVGCAGRRPVAPRYERIAAAARPILTLDPHAGWTSCYNDLVERAPESIEWLAEHPRLRERAAPDDLHTLVHVSLLRLLIHPALRPEVSATCLETTAGILHFDLRVAGRRLGPIAWPPGRPPHSWPAMYPEAFEHELAAQLNVEADRRALRRWWLKRAGGQGVLAAAKPLAPQADDLWPLLARRYADVWTYQPEPRSIRCGMRPPRTFMLSKPTADYNVVRAACVWLGAQGEPAIREHLITLVANPAPIVAHNAVLALSYDPDDRVRDVIERYKDVAPREEPPGASRPSPVVRRSQQRGPQRVNCAEQGSAAHEVDQVRGRLRRPGGGGGFHRDSVRQL